MIVTLKEGYRRLGIPSKWDTSMGRGNPTDSHEVQQYFMKAMMQQLRAEVMQKKPAVMLRKHTRKLLHGMRALSMSKECLAHSREQFYAKLFIALFALAAETTT